MPRYEHFLNDRCSGTIGLFLQITKNWIVLLREPMGERAHVQGDIKDAPFMNVHGESDMNLR